MKNLPDIISGRFFKDQMLRFIDSETIAKTLANPQFLIYLEKTVNGLFNSMALHLKDEPGNADEPIFNM